MTSKEALAPSESPAPSKLRRRLSFAAKLAVAGALIGVLWHNGYLEGDSLKRPLQHPGTVALAFSIGIVAISMSGLRWWLLLRGEGLPVGLWAALRLTWIGHLFNMLFPGAVSGDLMKMYYVGQATQDRRDDAWSTVIADRLIGLLALVALALVAAIANREFMLSRVELRNTLIVMFVVFGCGVAGGVVVGVGLGGTSLRLHQVLAALPGHTTILRAFQVFQRLARRPGTLAVTFTISFVAHSMSVFNAYLLGSAAFPDQGLELSHYLALHPIAMFANALPLTPGGLGVGEGVLGQLFAWSGLATQSQGVTVMLWWRGLFYGLTTLGALSYLTYGRGAPSQASPPPKTVSPSD